MAQVELHREEIAKAGAELTYIAAEKKNGCFKPVQYLEKHPISFPFLLDEDRAVTKAYGLYHRFGLDALNIAHPATLVIDRDRVVRYVYRGNNQHHRAPLESVMAAVAKVGGKLDGQWD
jgi:peroxiredoxin